MLLHEKPSVWLSLPKDVSVSNSYLVHALLSQTGRGITGRSKEADFPEAPQHERVSHLLLKRRRERGEKRLPFIFSPIKTVLQGDSAKWAKPGSCYPINKIVHIVLEL